MARFRLLRLVQIKNLRMQPFVKTVFILITGMTISCNLSDKRSKAVWPAGATPPVAPIKPYERNIHGETTIDHYYWLNDYFKEGPDSANVIAYLQAENAYTDSMMKHTEGLQEKLFTEMRARIKEKDESVPYLKNGYYYYTRTEEGKQYFKFCRKKERLDAPEEILLDIDEMAQGFSYYSATGFSVSDDNRLLAFGVDTVSRRQYTLYIKNLETGALFSDAITHTDGYSEWAADNNTLFYTENNARTLLSEKIKRHVLSRPVTEDVTVYHETDPTNYIGLQRSKSGKFIFITSAGTLSSEVRYIRSDNPGQPFAVFQPRMKDVLYDVDDKGDRFYITTNLGARNFRLMEAPYEQTHSNHWTEVIPHRDTVLLQGIEVFKDFLVVNERHRGLVKLRVIDHVSGSDYYIDFGEPTYAAGIGQNETFDTNRLRYVFTSFVTPNSVFDFDLASREKQLMKQTEVGGSYNAADYTSERLYATAADGTAVPVSLVYKKGLSKDGSHPLLLYGYGSYGVNMDAYFSSSRLSLLDRGFVFAIAHIRGGQEMGRYWYEEGKMMKKKNTFTDFISCGEFLVKEKFTSPAHLYAMGGSAGGLLMGAVANMAPELWNGLVVQVPFVDVVNTMLDETIPLTTNEYDEWGNPNDKDAYLYMKSYSPYENIVAKAYPNMLVTTGLHDSQVQYFEPAKWVAKLRTLKTDTNVLLLKTNMDYGHGGASGRFDYLKEIALEYAFLLNLEGISQ